MTGHEIAKLLPPPYKAPATGLVTVVCSNPAAAFRRQARPIDNMRPAVVCSRQRIILDIGLRVHPYEETAMPWYERGDVRIRYEEVGSGFPLLVIPDGGLNSTVAGLATHLFNPMAEFAGE